MAKQEVRIFAVAALCAMACMASLFEAADARTFRELRGGSRRALDDIASSRRALTSIEDDFVIYEDTACDDDTIESARQLEDWEGCRMWCSETPDCVAFDYNERSSKCFLKGSWTKIKPGEGHISGVVKDQAGSISVAIATAFQRMDDMECGGDEISNGILKNVESREQCEEACESRVSQGCRAYTYNTFNKKCYLKKDECVGQKDIGRFSGKLAGSGDSQPTAVYGDSVERNFKRMDDIECGGDEIPNGMIKKVQSRESCESECSSRGPDCQAYTWNSIDKRCYLKKDACIPETPDMGRFSGKLVEVSEAAQDYEVEEADYDLVVDYDVTIDEPSCPETNPPANRDFDEADGVTCDGKVIDVIDLNDCYDAPTRQNCGGECASNADCSSYSFDIYSKLCFFYSGDSCLSTSDNSNFESGLDFGSDDSYDSEYDYDYGSDY